MTGEEGKTSSGTVKKGAAQVVRWMGKGKGGIPREILLKKEVEEKSEARIKPKKGRAQHRN